MALSAAEQDRILRLAMFVVCASLFFGTFFGYYLPASKAVLERKETGCIAVRVVSYVGTCSCVAHREMCLGSFTCERHTTWWQYRNITEGPPPHNDTRDEAGGSGPLLGSRRSCWYNLNTNGDLSFDDDTAALMSARACVGVLGTLLGLAVCAVISPPTEDQQVHPLAAAPAPAVAPAAAADDGAGPEGQPRRSRRHAPVVIRVVPTPAAARANDGDNIPPAPGV